MHQRETASSVQKGDAKGPGSNPDHPMRVQLRHLGYADQVAALAPRDGAPAAVQLSRAAGGDAPVQREDSEETDKPMPATPQQAVELKDSGIEWANTEIRKHYKTLTGSIPAQNETWEREGVPAEERARRAFEIRHNARLTCRAMMGSRFEVIMLQIRDWWQYSSFDGPDFAWLVNKAKAKGLQGDAIYEEIIGSANRTNKTVDRAMGVDQESGNAK